MDNTSVDEFRSLLDLNLVSYFVFCKVRALNMMMLQAWHKNVNLLTVFTKLGNAVIVSVLF